MNIDYIHLYGSIRSLITILATFVLFKYYLYLVIAPFYSVQKAIWKYRISKFKRQQKNYKAYQPLVSVIIPAWNEEVGIADTVGSVLDSSYQNIEIVVVSDGSTDGTAEVVRGLVEKVKKERAKFKGKKLIFLEKENAGKGPALNFGITRSKGEIIVTMDADSLHHVDAVKNIVWYFQDTSVDALVGNVQIYNNYSLVGSLQELEYLFGFYFKRVHSLFNAEYIFGGACAAFRKSTTFDVIGLFDEQHKTEDIEYSLRTQVHGLKSVYAEDVIVYTEGASDLSGLFKQRLRWKKGRIDTFWSYRSLFFSRDSKHSKFLGWIVLPYAVFGELQLLVEPMFFAVIWTYTLISGDYLSIGLSSLFIFLTYISALIFGNSLKKSYYLALFPTFWLLFYVLVWVEFISLIESAQLIYQGKDVVWQKWDRKGLKGDVV